MKGKIQRKIENLKFELSHMKLQCCRMPLRVVWDAWLTFKTLILLICLIKTCYLRGHRYLKLRQKFKWLENDHRVEN